MYFEQQIRCFIGIVVIIALGVYPPWLSSHTTTPFVDSKASLSMGNNILRLDTQGQALTSQLMHSSTVYSLIWDPPSQNSYTTIDTTRLLMQWFMTMLFFGFFIYAGRTRKNAAAAA